MSQQAILRLQVATVISLMAIAVSGTYWLVSNLADKEHNVDLLRIEIAQLRSELIRRTEEHWRLTDHAQWAPALGAKNPDLIIPPVGPMSPTGATRINRGEIIADNGDE